MSFYNLGAAIWHRWTIICEVPSKISDDDKPETINWLFNDNIREAIGEIQLHTIDVLKNWTDRVGYGMASRGGSRLNEIIFHY